MTYCRRPRTLLTVPSLQLTRHSILNIHRSPANQRLTTKKKRKNLTIHSCLGLEKSLPRWDFPKNYITVAVCLQWEVVFSLSCLVCKYCWATLEEQQCWPTKTDLIFNYRNPAGRTKLGPQLTNNFLIVMMIQPHRIISMWGSLGLHITETSQVKRSYTQ